MKGVSPRIGFLISLVGIVGLWELLPLAFDVPEYTFPRISVIIPAMIDKASVFTSHLGVTAMEALLGFLVGSAFGFLWGVLLSESPLFRNLSLPWIVALNTIPIIALAPVFILWFGHGIISKVMIAAFICFFPLCLNTYKGLTKYNPEIKAVFDVYGGTKWDFLFRYKLKNAGSFIHSGLLLNATFAVIGAIVAEFVGADQGIGYGILQATYSLNAPEMWGYILIGAGLGITFYGLVLSFKRFLTYRL